jgi:very-short-patch-repair endonuclease
VPAYHNQEWQNQLRKELRNNQTQAEWKLWYYLARKQLGVKFRRQFGIGRYIVDFYCTELRMVIEVDGGIHLEPDVMKNDQIRQSELEANGLIVMRFTNREVLCNMEGVLEAIKVAIARVRPHDPL